MVSTQGSSQVSAKKQQNISSFFTKGTAPKLPPLRSIISNPSNRTSGDNEEDLFVSEEENANIHTSKTVTTPKHVLDVGLDLPKAKRVRRSESDAAGQTQQTTLNGSLGNEQSVASDQQLTIPNANKVKASRAGKQTSKYTFSSSPNQDEERQDDDEETKRRNAKLRERFVKKLGRPDSIAEIRRRNGLIGEETVRNEEDGGGDDADDGENEPHSRPMVRGRKDITGRKKAGKLTPMEEQYLGIKRKHLDTIIIMEVGYKFKFFGEDARIAAKELSIVCIPGKFRYDEHVSEAHLDRFASASIPVHRLHVHVKRLVGAGLKVGVVRQLETAALKAAGDNRNAPFVRELTNLYTKGTYIDDAEGLEASIGAPSGGAPATGYLVCLTEHNGKGWGTDEKVHVGLVAVQPATGDMIHDDFEDGFMRSEIETRLLHIAPCEILVVGNLSKATDKLVEHLAGSKTNVFGDKVRLERVDKPKTMVAQAYSHVSNFYGDKLKSSSAEEDELASKALEKVLKLTECVTICLSAMITYLSDYGLEHVFDLTKYFQSFSARSHMLLNGTTLTSLEIYQNQTDHTEKGSLFWTLDRTRTRFGQRLLRKWVGRPLLVKSELEKRSVAVAELKGDQPSIRVDKIKHLLSQVRSDLEKSLIRIYYGKCTRPELLNVLQTMQRIATEFTSIKKPVDAGFRSEIINDAIAALPTIAQDVISYLEQINPEAAKADDKYSFFREEMEGEDIMTHKMGIAGVEYDLDAHRSVAAEKIKRRKVEYVTVAGIEYLVEVENTQIHNVPASWAKISGTKKVSRFHTPEVVALVRERDQHKEALAAACDVAFSKLLAEISSKYQSFRDCVQALATLDCLLSLAAIASQPGYVKPDYADDLCIAIKQGRHPMVEQLLLDAYVPNDTELASDRTRALLVTGPNMGGKSSYVRQIALIAIMGQIGSYVPAESAHLGMLDAVLTRMGAFDNMMAGESTFMVELSETSDILKRATPRSLIILDELGRGTSTHDGVAIAQAVLDHVVRDKRSLTLFITHYQNLSALAKGFENGELKNVHMRFEETGDDGQEITFLYEVADGVAHRSYGLNVARLANIPESVLEVAAGKSKQLEHEAAEKSLNSLSQSLRTMASDSSQDQLDNLITCIEQL